MKKRIIVSCLILLLILVVSGTVWAQRNIRIMVNGGFVTSDVPPQMINGRVMVPLRAVAEALKANVEWDGQKSLVTITTTNEPVLRYWSNTNLSIPPIEAPDDLKALIKDAYELLREKAPDAYKAATAYVSKIEYSTSLSDDLAAQIILPNATMQFGKAYYERVSQLDNDSAVRLTALAIVHETTHAQVYFSGLSSIIDKNDNEIISTLVEHRIASLLGDERLLESVKSRITERMNNL